MQPTFAIYSTKALNLKGNFLSFLTDTEKKLLRLTLGRLLLLQKTYSIPRSFFFFFFSYQVCIAMRQVEEGSEEIEKQPRLTTKKTVSRDCTRKSGLWIQPIKVLFIQVMVNVRKPNCRQCTQR